MVGRRRGPTAKWEGRGPPDILYPRGGETALEQRRSTFAILTGAPIRGLRHLFRERQILIHDGMHTRRMTLGTIHQLAVLSVVIALIAWAGVATSAYVHGLASAAARDGEITRRVTELDGIKADYRAAFDRVDQFQRLFASVTCEITSIQRSLLRVAERNVAPDHRGTQVAKQLGAPPPCPDPDAAASTQSVEAAPMVSDPAGADTGRIVGSLRAPNKDAIADRVTKLTEQLDNLRQTHGNFLRESADIAAQRVGELERALSRVGVDTSSLASPSMEAAARAQQNDGRTASFYGTGGPFVAMPKELTPEPPFDPIAVFNTRADRLDNLILALRSLPLAAPLTEYEVTSPFGSRDDPFNEMPGFHEGVDLGAPVGSPILATGDGTVEWAGWRDRYGNLVIIDHGHGLTTRYAHLARVLVRVGDRLLRGHPVGLLGNSGRSTGPHLHYEVRINDVATDPMKFIMAGRDVLKTQ